MLEWLREHSLQTLQKGRDTALRWTCLLCPRIRDILSDHIERMAGCVPLKADDYHYQIDAGVLGIYAVDLRNWTCDCRKWDISGIPCTHAICAILKQKWDPEHFVDPCYHVETYKRAYAPVIYPISGEELWSQSVYISPLPPNFGRGIGRPKKVRRREPNEPNKHGKKRGRGRRPTVQIMPRQTPTIHCSCCREPGHNVRACPKKADPPRRPNKKAIRRADGEGTSNTERTSSLDNVGQGGTINISGQASHPPRLDSTIQTLPNGPEIMPRAFENDLTSIVENAPNTTYTTGAISSLLNPPARNVPGPTPYQQLQMGNPNMEQLPNFTIQTELFRRAPFSGARFTSRSSGPTVPKPRKKRSNTKNNADANLPTQESTNN